LPGREALQEREFSMIATVTATIRTRRSESGTSGALIYPWPVGFQDLPVRKENNVGFLNSESVAEWPACPE